MKKRILYQLEKLKNVRLISKLSALSHLHVSKKILIAMCAILDLLIVAGFLLFGNYFSNSSKIAVDSAPLAADTDTSAASDYMVFSSAAESISSQPEDSSSAEDSIEEDSEPLTKEEEIELIQAVEKPRDEGSNSDNSSQEEYRAPDVPSQSPPSLPEPLPDTNSAGESYLISMDNILQNPALPTGCEITALTMTLNHYGYNVSKETMADDYLPRSVDFSNIDGQKYGPDFRYYFAGNPYTNYGYGCLSPAIVDAANSYLSTHGNKHKATNISGSDPSVLYDCVKSGVPVVVWVTVDMREPYVSGGWYVNDTGEYLEWTSREHCVVLTGVEGDNIIINDSLAGVVSHSKALFEERYVQLGRQAVILQPTSSNHEPSSSSSAASSQASSSPQSATSSQDSSSQQSSNMSSKDSSSQQSSPSQAGSSAASNPSSDTASSETPSSQTGSYNESSFTSKESSSAGNHGEETSSTTK